MGNNFATGTGGNCLVNLVGNRATQARDMPISEDKVARPGMARSEMVDFLRKSRPVKSLASVCQDKVGGGEDLQRQR